MKIIYFAHSLLNRGGDKMVLAHFGWLATHGHEVELRCNIVNTILTIPEEVRITRPRFSGPMGTVLSALWERNEADAVIASIIPMACFLFPRSRGKMVYFAQDYDESYYTSIFMKGLVRFFYYVGLRIFRIPTIAVSKSLAELLKRRFNTHVEVAENGVNARAFYPDPAPEFVIAKDNRRAMLLLSRRDRRKGFDIAQAVIKSLSKSHPSAFEVWTVGELCSGAFTGIVHRDFGYQPEEKLRQLMSSADLFLYPSRHEGFGLMPLEAFACECPVVTTKAVPYAVDGINALVTAIEDGDALYEAVVKIIENPLLAKKLAANGAFFAKESSLESSSSKFAKFLEGIPCH